MSSTKLRSLNAYSDWETREGIVNVTNYVLSIQNNKEPEYPAKFTTKEKRNYDKKFGSDYFVETGTITGGVVTRGKRRDYTFREEKEAPTPKKAKKTAKKATKRFQNQQHPLNNNLFQSFNHHHHHQNLKNRKDQLLQTNLKRRILTMIMLLLS